MNKIVREHYPVSQLPEDLRAQFPGVETVRLVIEEGGRDDSAASSARRSRDQMIADFDAVRRENHPHVSLDDAVARIRSLRNEWDD